MIDTEIINDEVVKNILTTNDSRNNQMFSHFNPITGYGSIGSRVKVFIADFAIPTQWLPAKLAHSKFVRSLVKAGSIHNFLSDVLHVQPNDSDFRKVSNKLIRLRLKEDFAFCAASLMYIHHKDGGEDVLFNLWYPQRILVSHFEEKRLAGLPIRLILLKARQWGGSTTTQLYMAWLQFFHKRGLNSLIIAHQGAASDEIKDMFDTMIKKFPVEFLHKFGEQWAQDEPKFVGVGKSGSTSRVPQRGCKIKIGTAERPDGCRGGAYSLVHLSEVGIWKKTDGKSPEDIVRSACSGILLRPLTMIVMESTANGTGNFFHTEYTAAANPATKSQFSALFIPWFQIPLYRIPFKSAKEKADFALCLYHNRNNDNIMSAREDSGKYNWWLWEMGATLEAINWYILERAGKNSHAVMASEFPTDDVEAFVHSGSMVFDKYLVREFERDCRPPRFIGDVYSDASEGINAIRGLRFHEDNQGLLWIWSKPEIDSEVKVTDRYLTVVDVGGRTAKADWSVIVVFDRVNMMDGLPPAVVAQWYGHCDIDKLAWKAAQIAAYYDNSLLVIESNTIETHDKERHIEGGDQSLYILSQLGSVYPNLYARRQSEDEIRQGIPRKYGFHTNSATKPMIITLLIKVVREHLYTERDVRCLHEYLVYERKQNGAYGAIDGEHDDLLMTRAIGMRICFEEMDIPQIVPRRTCHGIKHTAPISEACI